jgi:hypothetical protein
LGTTSSPFTVESAYASVRTIAGRTGADILDEELELIIDEAKAGMAQHLLEELIITYMSLRTR